MNSINRERLQSIIYDLNELYDGIYGDQEATLEDESLLNIVYDCIADLNLYGADDVHTAFQELLDAALNNTTPVKEEYVGKHLAKPKENTFDPNVYLSELIANTKPSPGLPKTNDTEILNLGIKPSIPKESTILATIIYSIDKDGRRLIDSDIKYI